MGKESKIVKKSIEEEKSTDVKFAAGGNSKATAATGDAKDAKGKDVMSREEDIMAQIRELTEQNELLKNLVDQMADQKRWIQYCICLRERLG